MGLVVIIWRWRYISSICHPSCFAIRRKARTSKPSVSSQLFVVDRPPLSTIYPVGSELHHRQHIDQRQADGTHAPWTPTSTDLLAADWVATRW